MAKRQFYKVSLEGLDSCTLVLACSSIMWWNESLDKNCKLCLKSLVLGNDDKDTHLHERSKGDMDIYAHSCTNTHALTKG